MDRRGLKILASFYGKIVLQANEIIPRLYIADMYTATDPLTLESIGITHIVSVIGDLESSEFPSNIKQLFLPLEDGVATDICHLLDSAVEWIKGAMDADEGSKILVHCMCGISRSPSVVTAYLMATQGMSLSESLGHVKGKRRVACPHPRFMKQLKEYEETLAKLQGLE